MVGQTTKIKIVRSIITQPHQPCARACVCVPARVGNPRITLDRGPIEGRENCQNCRRRRYLSAVRCPCPAPRPVRGRVSAIEVAVLVRLGYYSHVCIACVHTRTEWRHARWGRRYSFGRLLPQVLSAWWCVRGGECLVMSALW